MKSTQAYLSLLLVAALSPIASYAKGASGGGGGSEEAKIFASVARRSALSLATKKETRKYSTQLLDTLDSVEIYLVDSLANTCDGEGAIAKFYAYSCAGKIYLLNAVWGATGKKWLTSESVARTHVKDILHEVFRAGDPKSATYVTNDAGYSVTSRFGDLQLGNQLLCTLFEGVMTETHIIRDADIQPGNSVAGERISVWKMNPVQTEIVSVTFKRLSGNNIVSFETRGGTISLPLNGMVYPPPPSNAWPPQGSSYTGEFIGALSNGRPVARDITCEYQEAN